MLPLTHDILRCHAPLPASAKASARRRNQGRAGALAEAASGASSIPETVVLEPKSRGVLDRPVKPDDDSCVENDKAIINVVPESVSP